MKKCCKTMKKNNFNLKVVKTIPESLKKLIGKEIIRIGPTSTGDWSYSDMPVLFEGFTSDNKMKIKYIKEHALVFFDEQIRELPFCFTDEQWILLEDALKAEGNKLNKLIGKKIKRIRPVYYTKLLECSITSSEEYREDYSYMCKYANSTPVTLVSASKYHMLAKEYDSNGKEKLVIIGPRYSNPEDWVEVRK